MPKVDQLFAYIIAEKDENDEGVPAIKLGNDTYPLMGADIERMRGKFREVAQSLADDRGKKVVLIKSTAIEVVEVIEPRQRNES